MLEVERNTCITRKIVTRRNVNLEKLKSAQSDKSNLNTSAARQKKETDEYFFQSPNFHSKKMASR